MLPCQWQPICLPLEQVYLFDCTVANTSHDSLIQFLLTNLFLVIDPASHLPGICHVFVCYVAVIVAPAVEPAVHL